MTDWTIMMYISADNLLANFAVESLKQLRDAAGEPFSDATDDNIVVVAEFDDSQEADARMYFFDGDPAKRALSINESRIKADELRKVKTIRKVDMTRRQTLTDFVNFAYTKSKTKHYCLVLWGHGIELLLDEDRRFGTTNKPARRYLSIGDLREALLKTELVKNQVEGKPGPHLDIVGLDACSMSMAELATELQGCADFMIASQEDVPDASFPYGKILMELRRHKAGDDVREVCKKIPELYGKAFEDYVATPNTGVKGITLSSLDLNRVAETLTAPVQALAQALLAASSNRSLRARILSARKKSQDSVFGLLVDLYDFCKCLMEELSGAGIKNRDLQSACNRFVRRSIWIRTDSSLQIKPTPNVSTDSRFTFPTETTTTKRTTRRFNLQKEQGVNH